MTTVGGEDLALVVGAAPVTRCVQPLGGQGPELAHGLANGGQARAARSGRSSRRPSRRPRCRRARRRRRPGGAVMTTRASSSLAQTSASALELARRAAASATAAPARSRKGTRTGSAGAAGRAARGRRRSRHSGRGCPGAASGSPTKSEVRAAVGQQVLGELLRAVGVLGADGLDAGAGVAGDEDDRLAAVQRRRPWPRGMAAEPSTAMPSTRVASWRRAAGAGRACPRRASA